MNNEPNGNSAGAPGGSTATNPCLFMKLPKCMRQDTTKRVDVTICNACIAGRTEGHLFEIKKKLVGDNNQRN
jgi:hypothetical protein